MGIVPHHYFPWKDLKCYIKKEDGKCTIVMERFNSILFHKSGSSIYLSTNQFFYTLKTLVCVTYFVKVLKGEDYFSYVDPHLLFSELLSLVEVCEQFPTAYVICNKQKHINILLYFISDIKRKNRTWTEILTSDLLIYSFHFLLRIRLASIVIC